MIKEIMVENKSVYSSWSELKYFVHVVVVVFLFSFWLDFCSTLMNFVCNLYHLLENMQKGIVSELPNL